MWVNKNEVWSYVLKILSNFLGDASSKIAMVLRERENESEILLQAWTWHATEGKDLSGYRFRVLESLESKVRNVLMMRRCMFCWTKVIFFIISLLYSISSQIFDAHYQCFLWWDFFQIFLKCTIVRINRVCNVTYICR